jgi:hypothetical protein
MNPLSFLLAAGSLPTTAQEDNRPVPTDDPHNRMPWLEDLECRALDHNPPQYHPHGPLLGMEPHRAKPEKKKARKAQKKARKQNRKK